MFEERKLKEFELTEFKFLSNCQNSVNCVFFCCKTMQYDSFPRLILTTLRKLNNLKMIKFHSNEL